MKPTPMVRPTSTACRRSWPGQIRGITRLASVVTRLYELDPYEDAELVRRKNAAMYGGFIEEGIPEPTADNPLPGTPDGKDAKGNQVIKFAPGMFINLPPGAKVTFSDPADVGGNYLVWIIQQIRSIAVGAGLTYEQLIGDLSGVNYSSIRAGLLEFQRLAEAIQAGITSLSDVISKHGMSPKSCSRSSSKTIQPATNWTSLSPRISARLERPRSRLPPSPRET